MTATITAVTVCKNRLPDLQESLPRLLAAGFDEVVLVDYACPQHCGDWARTHHPSVKLVRHESDDGFSAAKARNLGAQAAQSKWIFFVDADILAGPEFLPYMRTLLKDCHYYVTEAVPFRNNRVAYGSFIVSKDDFLRVDGFDEIYTGWGCEDDDIYHKFDISGVRKAEFPGELVSEIVTPEELRMLYSPVKTKAVQHVMNRMYLCVKKHFFAMRSGVGDLPLELRESIYSTVQSNKADILELLQAPGRTKSIVVQFKPRPLRAISPLSGSQTLTMKFEIRLNELIMDDEMVPSIDRGAQ